MIAGLPLRRGASAWLTGALARQLGEGGHPLPQVGTLPSEIRPQVRAVAEVFCARQKNEVTLAPRPRRRGLLAMRKQELLRPLAKDNERIRKGNQPGASLAKLPNLTKLDTRRAAAKANAKRSEAAKAQPRTGDGKRLAAGQVVVPKEQQPAHKRAKARAARAKEAAATAPTKTS